jgi:hypothetical protein
VAQAGNRSFSPSISTIHIRQLPVGEAPFRWQRVGISIWFRLATVRMVSPDSKANSFPLITIVSRASIPDSSPEIKSFNDFILKNTRAFLMD